MSYTKDRKQKVKEKAQPLTLIDHYENVLGIKDEELGKTVDIMIRGGILFLRSAYPRFRYLWGKTT